MSDNLHIPWLDNLAKKLSPNDRRRLLAQMARTLRMLNRQRIIDQRNPDGSAYQERKPRQGKGGRIRRRKMFMKIRTNRYLRLRTTPDQASVGYNGRIARIVEVHQYGLLGYVDKARRIKAHYPKRQLLGYTPQDIREIERIALQYITDGLL